MIINLSDKRKSASDRKRERDKKVEQMRSVMLSWDRKAMQEYVGNRNKKFPLTDAGMAAILERFNRSNEFKIGDMSEELRVGFDIVLSIARNKKIDLPTTDLILEFVKQYEEVIHFFDRQSAQTYHHKLLRAYENSVDMVKKKYEIEKALHARY